MFLAATTFATIAVLWGLYRLSRIGERQAYLPPGPPTKPVLGNLLDFPTHYPHRKFTEWAKQFGEIFSVKLLNNNVVVVSSAKLAREILEIKGSATADRPAMYFAQIIYGNYEVVLARYGPVWRKLHRVLHDFLTREKCMQHLEVQEAQSAVFMRDVLENPDNLFTHCRRYSGSVVLSVGFGIHCTTYENSYVGRVYKTMAQVEEIFKPGGAPPVDIFPILKYVPEMFASWKDHCREIRKTQRGLFFELLEVCENRIASGKRRGCFIEDVLDKKQAYDVDREMIAYIGATLLEAGTETTAVNLQSFLMCMAANPEAQAKAQKEIDDVVGHSRMPEQKDLDDLPYVRAVLNEVARMRPVAPTSLPHATTSDEKIRDYVLPKGTMIFANLWSILRDPEFFDRPNEFLPERYLLSEFGTKPGVDDTGYRNDLMFGHGRRICPGRVLALNSVAIGAMNLLWSFNIRQAKGSAPIDIADSEDIVLLAPKPFKFDIKPRDAAKADVIRAQYNTAQAVFDRFQDQ